VRAPLTARHPSAAREKAVQPADTTALDLLRKEGEVFAQGALGATSKPCARALTACVCVWGGVQCKRGARQRQTRTFCAR
jgi:hypothetical protein